MSGLYPPTMSYIHGYPTRKRKRTYVSGSDLFSPRPSYTRDFQDFASYRPPRSRKSPRQPTKPHLTPRRANPGDLGLVRGIHRPPNYVPGLKLNKDGRVFTSAKDRRNYTNNPKTTKFVDWLTGKRNFFTGKYVSAAKQLGLSFKGRRGVNTQALKNAWDTGVTLGSFLPTPGGPTGNLFKAAKAAWKPKPPPFTSLPPTQFWKPSQVRYPYSRPPAPLGRYKPPSAPGYTPRKATFYKPKPPTPIKGKVRFNTYKEAHYQAEDKIKSMFYLGHPQRGAMLKAFNNKFPLSNKLQYTLKDLEALAHYIPG